MSDDSNKIMAKFADCLTRFHLAELAGDDQIVRDAVIIKMTALTVLAFDASAIDDEPVDVEGAISRLRTALMILKNRKTFQS